MYDNALSKSGLIAMMYGGGQSILIRRLNLTTRGSQTKENISFCAI
jgi:hypothetical protein